MFHDSQFLRPWQDLSLFPFARVHGLMKSDRGRTWTLRALCDQVVGGETKEIREAVRQLESAGHITATRSRRSPRSYTYRLTKARG